jgi:AraC-like DNA-binding protein
MNHKSFCIRRDIKYKEIIVDHKVFNKFYEITNPNCLDIISIPDGCVDIEFLWKGDQAKAYVCGSLLSGRKSGIGTYDRCFGIRFNPGSIPECFKDSMKSIVDNRCELSNYMNLKGINIALNDRLSLDDKADYFLENFRHQAEIEPHLIITFVTNKIKDEAGLINVGEIINSLGYSHCYVDRIFKAFVGVSVKKYANIIRLQQAVDIVRENKADEVYDRLGFYDQAHFIHEFKRFTSITPNVFFKMKEIEIV